MFAEISRYLDTSSVFARSKDLGGLYVCFQVKTELDYRDHRSRLSESLLREVMRS